MDKSQAPEKAKSIIMDLGRQGREGVVIKDPQIKPSFMNLEVLDLFKEHLRMGVEAKFQGYTQQDDRYVLHLERQMKSTTDKIANILKGNVW